METFINKNECKLWPRVLEFMQEYVDLFPMMEEVCKDREMHEYIYSLLTAKLVIGLDNLDNLNLQMSFSQGSTPTINVGKQQGIIGNRRYQQLGFFHAQRQNDKPLCKIAVDYENMKEGEEIFGVFIEPFLNRLVLEGNEIHFVDITELEMLNKPIKPAEEE